MVPDPCIGCLHSAYHVMQFFSSSLDHIISSARGKLKSHYINTWVNSLLFSWDILNDVCERIVP